MFRIIVFSLFLTIKPSWSYHKCPSSRTIPLIPKDYSKVPYQEFTSGLPRSNLSTLLNYIWSDISTEMDRLREQYKPNVLVPMGASVPNFLPPRSLLDALELVSRNRSDPGSYTIHQYSRGKGHLDLVTTIAKFFSILMSHPRSKTERPIRISPFKEVLVTVGASNALDLAARAFLNPGDEVIILEPFFLMLRSIVLNVHAKPVFVPFILKNGTTGQNSNDWTFDKIELKSKITRKTKMIWINNPNNPNGKAFTREELVFIGDLAQQYNLIILSDEAGFWYQFDHPGHIHIASLPRLFQRTISIHSGTKLFHNSGWKIGWAIAPEQLLWPMATISEKSIVSVPTPLQIAYAIALRKEINKMGSNDSHKKQLYLESLKNRNQLVSILKSIGADVIVPTAGYCLVANFTRLADQIDLSSERDCRPGMRFWTFLIKKGISVNPTSIYYSPQSMWKSEYTIRLTFMKTQKTIEDFGKVIKTIFKTISDKKLINSYNYY